MSHNGGLIVIDTATGECYLHEGSAWTNLAPPIEPNTVTELPRAGRVKPLSAADIEAAVNNDSECVRLQESLAALDSELSESLLKEGTVAQRSASDHYAKLRKSLEAVLADRRQRLIEQLQTAKGGDTK